MELKIAKAINIEIPEWDIKISATSREIGLKSTDHPLTIEIEYVPEFIRLLSSVYADVTRNIHEGE